MGWGKKEEETEDTRAACYLARHISLSIAHGSISSGQVWPLLWGIEGISNCCLPWRFVLLWGVCHLFCGPSCSPLRLRTGRFTRPSCGFQWEKGLSGKQYSRVVLNRSLSDLGHLIPILVPNQTSSRSHPQLRSSALKDLL